MDKTGKKYKCTLNKHSGVAMFTVGKEYEEVKVDWTDSPVVLNDEYLTSVVPNNSSVRLELINNL